MPTLNWIGKGAVVTRHQQVRFRLLKDVPELGCGDPGSGNLIVQGDNLAALKALLPYYGALAEGWFSGIFEGGRREAGR